MSFEAKFPLGLHEFLRFAIPGYVYLFVLLPPIFATGYNSLAILLLLSLPEMLLSALLIVAGPVLGFLIFHIYYALFKHCSYTVDKIEAFVLIREYAKDKLEAKDKWRIESEFFVRALEDFAVHAKSHSGTLEPLKERMIFLFSSFHSLGASLVAVAAGMLSWGIWGILNRLISGQTFELPSPDAIVTAVSGPSGWVFIIFAILWTITSYFLFRSWRHRKNLAIELEFLLAAMSKYHVNKVVKAI